MKRTRYRIEWRKLGTRTWIELGTTGGRADTFRTRREAARRAAKLEHEQFGGVVTRIVAPPKPRRNRRA